MAPIGQSWISLKPYIPNGISGRQTRRPPYHLLFAVQPGSCQDGNQTDDHTLHIHFESCSAVNFRHQIHVALSFRHLVDVATLVPSGDLQDPSHWHTGITKPLRPKATMVTRLNDWSYRAE